jgi:hypothetical protein
MATRYRIPQSLSDALDFCLARCYRDDSPMLRLCEGLDELRHADWPEEDVRRVELIVLKRLVGLQTGRIHAKPPAADDTVID